MTVDVDGQDRTSGFAVHAGVVAGAVVAGDHIYVAGLEAVDFLYDGRVIGAAVVIKVGIAAGIPLGWAVNGVGRGYCDLPALGNRISVEGTVLNEVEVDFLCRKLQGGEHDRQGKDIFHTVKLFGKK